MSWSGPWKSISQSATPRMPVQTVGVVSDHMPVSETITTSAASSPARASTSSRKWMEPDSSSPSTISLRFTAGAAAPVAARCARTPRVWKNTCPLSSAAPRPYMRPSRTTGSKGSVCQPSARAAGCTSWCPYTRTVGACGSSLGQCAKTAGAPHGLPDLGHRETGLLELRREPFGAAAYVARVLGLGRDGGDAEPLGEIVEEGTAVGVDVRADDVVRRGVAHAHEPSRPPDGHRRCPFCLGGSAQGGLGRGGCGAGSRGRCGRGGRRR